MAKRNNAGKNASTSKFESGALIGGKTTYIIARKKVSNLLFSCCSRRIQ